MSTNPRVLLAIAASIAVVASPQIVKAAASTWSGSTSAAWTNAANWAPGIPNPGDDVIIADSTGSGNSMNLTDSRTIGLFQFGASGTRTTTFQITNNVAGNTLTITNGFIANGNLATTEFSHVPIVIANDQTW